MFRYGRDYYINTEEENEVSSNEFEESVLRGGLMHIAFRANDATQHFVVNPLYEDNYDFDKIYFLPAKIKKQSCTSESGYASSVDSLNSSISGDRLAPPRCPEIIEKTFFNLRNLRKQGSLCIQSSRKRGKFGGSLRLSRTEASALLW